MSKTNRILYLTVDSICIEWTFSFLNLEIVCTHLVEHLLKKIIRIFFFNSIILRNKAVEFV